MDEWNPRSEENIKALVDRAIQRDAEAFGAVYDLYLDAVYRYLYYRLGSQTEAEDLTEQVFLKAWEAIHRFKWQGKPFAAWLYRLARNILIDHVRTRKSAVSLDDHMNLASPNSEAWIAQSLDAEELTKAIGQLTDEQQQVIVLKFLQGAENSEIAALMNKREGAIRALQLRALQALRRILVREQVQ